MLHLPESVRVQNETRTVVSQKRHSRQ